jgi:hypothetical protein
MTEEFMENGLDAPPCACGNDLGLPGGALPVYDENSSGILSAAGFVYIAVRAPATQVVRPVRSVGIPVSRITIQKGDLHVMASAHGGGGQFNLPAELYDPEDITQPGSFATADSHVAIMQDPRTILLRHFWRDQGYRRVTPIALMRTGDVPVLGRIAKVRLSTRWFDRGNVHGCLGRCSVVKEEGGLRFLKPGALLTEFSTLYKPDGSQVTL